MTGALADRAARCLGFIAMCGATQVWGAAPVSGAAFTKHETVGRLPNEEVDAEDVSLEVARHQPNVVDSAPPEACDLGLHAEREGCLQVPGRGCMWVHLETHDPTVPVQATNSYCLPCELDGEDIPCWSVGAWIGNKQVNDCVMSCAHQKRIFQPGYACSSGAGGQTESQCFEKGGMSGSSCMFLAYEDRDGQNQAVCSPCSLPGTGTWTCPAIGSEGPLDGSKVTACASQCDEPLPTLDPLLNPLAPVLPSPGVTKVASPAGEMLNAPNNVAMPPTESPLEAQIKAQQVAAAATGTAPALPAGYFPVLLYPSPADVFATTLAPMAASLPLWPSAWLRDGPRTPLPPLPPLAASGSEEASLLQQQGAGQPGSPQRRALRHRTRFLVRRH